MKSPRRRALRHEDAVLALVLLAIPAAIAEAHGGSLVVRNRAVGRGAEAVITLPSTVRERAG